MAAKLHPPAEPGFEHQTPEATATELSGWGNVETSFHATPELMRRVAAAHGRLLEHLGDRSSRIYGVHTGFGANVDSARDPLAWRKTQADLLEYLLVGTGDPLPKTVVRRALRLQCWKVGQGFSGIHPETFLALTKLADQDALPPVPSYGSLGASGDLVPMAHAIRPLFAASQPRGPRDVIGLVNTNAMMSSLALECLDMVRAQWRLGCGITAAASLALGTSDEPFEAEVLSLNRRQPQIRSTGEFLCDYRHRFRREFGGGDPVVDVPIQERYSIRCAPQVLGNIAENIDFATRRIVAEALSVADNPVVLDDRMWHGGLFYAAGLATASDLLQDAIARIAEMVDRQVLLLVGTDTNHGLPENLGVPGHSHVKGLHQLLSALNQGMRAYAVPARSLSFSCEGNNQDIVPCAMMALLQLRGAAALGQQVLKAAAFCAERALELRYRAEIPEYLSLAAWSRYEPKRFS